MVSYRFYRFGDDGHVKQARQIEFDSDEDALAAMRQSPLQHPVIRAWFAMRDCEAVEAWDRSRLVNRVEAERRKARRRTG